MAGVAEAGLEQAPGVAGDEIGGGGRVAVVNDACDRAGRSRRRPFQRFKEMVERIGGVGQTVNLVIGGVFVGVKAEQLVFDRRGGCLAGFEIEHVRDVLEIEHLVVLERGHGVRRFHERDQRQNYESRFDR